MHRPWELESSIMAISHESFLAAQALSKWLVTSMSNKEQYFGELSLVQGITTQAHLAGFAAQNSGPLESSNIRHYSQSSRARPETNTASCLLGSFVWVKLIVPGLSQHKLL